MTDTTGNPTHMFYYGPKNRRIARSPFEMCWKLDPHTDDTPDDDPTFCDKNLNGYGNCKEDGTPNEYGSFVVKLQAQILIIDPVNGFWGAGPTLEQAIAALPNNMEDLPARCDVFTVPDGSYVNDNGVLKVPGGAEPVLLFCRAYKRTYKTRELIRG